ncbi:MAG TPA: hypothetical protein VK508_21585 [Cyclobacteriaceae bacterium]|nr:hypothetical protein [Cyclobacteriaceae bacterium]
MKILARFLIVAFALMIFLINLFVDYEEHHDENALVELEEECGDASLLDSVLMDVTHNRSWVEYMKNTGFCSAYAVAYGDASHAEVSRNELNVPYYGQEDNYWMQIYSRLYLDSKDHLQSLQDSLASIGRSRGLDRDDFARMVVSFVQDIPYEYVIPDECTGQEVSPCHGNVAYGIYSPVEFLYAQHGDCDTRTVLLYTLLRNFGYEPLIINSREYLHSMVALDVASSGDDFEYNGKRYAYWETTNVGWLAGMLPPDMNNKDYWYVALDYEF